MRNVRGHSVQGISPMYAVWPLRPLHRPEAQVAADAQARKAAVDNAMALAQENSRNEQLAGERVEVKA